MVGARFAWITALMRQYGCYQPVALLRCYGWPDRHWSILVIMTRMLQWRPSALWHWSVSCLFSFSWQCPTDSLLGSGQAGVCWPIKDSIPWSLNQVLVVLAVCAGAKSCWKIKSASPRSQSLEKNWRGTECKMLEVQCEVSTICVGLGSHVICWCWSTVLY